MAGTTVTEDQIRETIAAAEKRMSPEQLRLWRCIAVSPNKWQQHPWGDRGGGFWVVAVVGRFAIWFNDIEDDFDIAEYQCPGEIGEFGGSQYQLEWAVQILLDTIARGSGRLQADGSRVGPPEAIRRV